MLELNCRAAMSIHYKTQLIKASERQFGLQLINVVTTRERGNEYVLVNEEPQRHLIVMCWHF